MAYCGPKGIPLSQFLTWPQDDQDAALLWQSHEGQRCTGCGTHPHEWDPERGGNPHAYMAGLRYCPGCARSASLANSEQAKHAGHGFHVVLTPPAQHVEEDPGGTD